MEIPRRVCFLYNVRAGKIHPNEPRTANATTLKAIKAEQQDHLVLRAVKVTYLPDGSLAGCLHGLSQLEAECASAKLEELNHREKQGNLD